MKNQFFLILMMFIQIPFTAQSQTIEERVKELLSKMTIEEKVGQMTQVTLEVVSKKQGNKNQNHELDEKKLEDAIVKYKVGSILNVYDVAHSIDYWHEVITKIQDIATKKTRLGIPVIYGIDAIHGATYTKGATLFPQALAVASTFNKKISERIGEITSIETRASGIPWNFYPVMDLGRQPLWPRLWETFGEDVYLAQQMGAAYIKGAQGDDISRPDKLATCLKHYVGYSFPFNGFDRTPAYMSERTLREYFLPPFEAGIKAGSKTVMVNSSEVDGIPGHANYHLLTEILRHELKFDGFVVSDWEDIKRLHTRDRIASTPEEAVRIAVMAGVDMSMVPYDFSFYEILVKLVKEGKVPMWRIDEAVSRILKVKFELGLFENPYPKKDYLKLFASPEHTQANLDAARESIILAKNENKILPLKKNIKVFVTGPTSNKLSPLNGGWTITWQGNEESLYPQEKSTILEAIQQKIGSKNVLFEEGVSFDKELNLSSALQKAKQSDVIILCLGEPAYCETPGNINDLTLPEAQLNYAQKLIATGKPLILVMVEGRPRLITKIFDKVKGPLIAFLPGMEGGNAIADILFGDVNPSGKLPISYPKYPNAIVHYDYKPIENSGENKYDPLLPFGFGLSYTQFSYSNLKLNKTEMTEDDEIIVSVDVKNEGSIAGKEAVLMYVTDLYGQVSRPNKQLKGFEKIDLNPGETKTVQFKINKEHLSFIGLENKRIIEPGEFIVTIGNLQQKFYLK
ncbi:MAG: glycoside hydrolase family 3 C-terminal domain-containing protein [Ignavibacteria bacterium]|nr:glycoside hydrolase family 3 C-terminal domain-containing protein [Ignavibacteria bacterium]